MDKKLIQEFITEYNEFTKEAYYKAMAADLLLLELEAALEESGQNSTIVIEGKTLEVEGGRA